MPKINIPTKKECIAILTKNKTPSNIIKHCKAVCKVAEDVAKKLIKKGIKVNKGLVAAAALLHDAERLKKNHVARGARLVKKLGYPEVANVISKHTLYKLKNNEPKTIEEKIVFYADKRVKHDKIVTLEERYKDLKERYKLSDFGALNWEMEFTKKIEKELGQ